MLFALGLLVTSLASAAEPARLLLAVGANVGDPDDAVLRFADDDAERVRRLFVELGGVRPDRALVVLNQGAPAVRQRLAELAGRVAELRASGQDVLLFVYVSSHADGGVLHLNGTHLPLAELREAARAAGARLTVMMVDACESGALLKKKGGSAAPEYDVSLERLPLNGEVFISSSGPGEASEEWDSLQGSLFTHHLLTGLRGDADAEGDGRVSLTEAYAYAYRRTVAGAAGAGQHPAYALQLSGTGELVLTEPAGAKSALVFPAEASGRWVVASSPRPLVVAEVDKVAGRPLRLAVPPGRYVLRKREGASTGLLEVELPFGGERAVREKELTWRRYTEVALKGGEVHLRPHALALVGRAGTAPVTGAGASLSAALLYRHTRGPLWAQATLGGGLAGYRGVALDIRERSLGAGAAVGWRWMDWAVVPHVGLALDVTALEQRRTRDQEAEVRRVFGVGPLPTLRSAGVSVGPLVALELPLPGRSFALAQVQGGLRYLPSREQADLRPTAQLSLGVGQRF